MRDGRGFHRMRRGWGRAGVRHRMPVGEDFVHGDFTFAYVEGDAMLRHRSVLH